MGKKAKAFGGADVSTTPEAPLLCSTRLGLALLGFLGFINVYALRVNLSVAIVCMVNRTAVQQTALVATASNSSNSSSSSSQAEGNGDLLDTCQGSANASALDFQEGSFLWDKPTQGMILGAYFWGYLVSQIPSGWLATRIGGKRVYGYSMLVSGLLTLLTPVLSGLHFAALMVVRIVLGVLAGMTFPAMHTMWGAWAPPMERSKLTAFTYAGAQVGNVITFPLAGFLCKYGFAGGWPSIFYVLGALTVVWVAVWMFLVSDNPNDHRRISDQERRYITLSLKDCTADEKEKMNVPWCKFMTSLPVYAIIVSNVTSDWGAYTLLTNIPTYMAEVLKFDITSNGLFSALPYIAFWAVINFSGWLADFVRKRNIASTTITRKSFDAFGKLVPALMLVGLGYVDCNSPAVAVVLLVMGVSLTGFQYSGFLVNHVDIAPAFAGILFGISNSIAAVTGFLAPYVVGVVTSESQTRAEWKIVFYIAAAIYAFGAIFYAFCASGELQPWARHRQEAAGEADHMVQLRSVVKERGDSQHEEPDV